jgi:hypothetical protein
MQLGSPLGRMRRKSNPSDWERIDLGQLVPSERAIARKGKRPQVTDPVTRLWIVTRQSDDRIFDKARIARKR